MSHKAALVLLPTLCFLISFLIMAVLHREALARVFGLFVRSHRSYFRLGPSNGGIDGELDGDSGSAGDKRAIVEFGASLALESESFRCDGDCPEIGKDGYWGSDEDEEDDLSDSEPMLDKYFDPYTSILRPDVLDPAAPVATWERKMDWRIRHGRGLGAWVDWVVDRGVGWFQRVMEGR
ncbi:hypothetical protein PHISP_08120 [Aspergillus sp. HF37]|nr:hypothetical protein PHISP_08120 [Aspergillus sp. HF37]